MFQLANDIKAKIQDIPGIADLNVEQQIERPQLVIRPRREMLARYGITLPQFSEFVSACLAGEAVSQVYEQGKSFDLVVRVRHDLHDEADKVRDLMIDTSDGRKVPLSYIADIRSAAGPNTISRENVKRKIVISANVDGRDLRSVVNDIQARIDADIRLPEGYHVEYGGQFESEQAASRTLTLASCVAIVVIFLLLYHQFRSARESLIILINLPLALIGGVPAPDHGRGQHPGRHRVHLALRHRHAQRHAAHQPLQPPATGGGLQPARQRRPRFAGPSEPHPHDRPLLGPGPHPAGPGQRTQRQRNPKPHGESHPGRTADLHRAQRVHHTYSIYVDPSGTDIKDVRTPACETFAWGRAG